MRLKLAPAILIPAALAMFFAIGIGMTLSALSNMQMVSRLLSAQQNELLQAIGTVQAGSIKFAKVEPIVEQLDDFASTPENGLADALVVDAQQAVVLDYPGLTEANQQLQALAAEAISTEQQVSRIDGDLHLSVVPVRFGKDNALVGAFGMAWDLGVHTEEILAEQTKNMLIGLGIGALALIGLGVLIMLHVIRPIGRLTNFATELSKNNLDVTQSDTGRRDEIGDLVSAMGVFHENALKMRDMTAAEAQRIIDDEAKRRETMAELQRAFGDVVRAAGDGDLTQRVKSDFADDELNTLSGSVNELLGTVDTALSETGDMLEALAAADLTQRMRGNYSGAFARLQTSANGVADRLSDIVGQIRTTSGGLKSATGEILAGANDLSDRTTKQAATIEETSAAMEQLSQTVMANAERASNASENAAEVTTAAEDGGAVMLKANDAMERITQSSSKISNIIGMIDDIAFQTNLLALNASVEAARAGEAGKGFAVVAIEVRRLAQSAAEASSEVKALIEQSANEVGSGSRLVAQAAEKLGAMQEAVKRNRDLLDGIARESRVQASSIDEVSSAIRQMDEMTQHNAALVEETNAAIEQTESQATDLDRIVSVFNVGGYAQDTAAEPAAAPAPARKPGGVRALQQKVKSAAQSYLSKGNTAIKTDDWAEF
ncbi:methyl-accepting chemotaxis protein [Devosia sp.]|uniref:methyl-accepting chemotaxis protein n=1 Tax=Devosia sp. TaxID=1871048 RepID=UPI003A928782